MPGGDITDLLEASGPNDEAALLQRVYDELKSLAAAQMRRERPEHTLSPTALVHETWLRLRHDPDLQPADRHQFFAIAARRMRQVLVDHARRRNAQRRGGEHRAEPLTLSMLPESCSNQPVDLLALDQCLDQLETLDARKARVVELRYFAGLEMAEIAALLGISRATAQRDWEVARSFLAERLT